jgi:hypothetical protein
VGDTYLTVTPHHCCCLLTNEVIFVWDLQFTVVQLGNAPPWVALTGFGFALRLHVLDHGFDLLLAVLLWNTITHSIHIKLLTPRS